MKGSLSNQPSLEVYLLGLVDFQEMQAAQRRIAYDLGERAGASLILCEHPPTISVGRAGSRAHLLPDDETLRSLGVGVHWVSRGGGCTLHLPGQLTAYLSVHLDTQSRTLAHYLESLDRAILGVLDEFDLQGEARVSPEGIFLGSSRVASVGIAVNRWITSHGFTLNVGPCLDLFDILKEPGFHGRPLRQTSMESRRQRLTPMPKVREAIVRHLERVLGMERHHVYTSHPLIRRKVLSHVYAPSPG